MKKIVLTLILSISLIFGYIIFDMSLFTKGVVNDTKKQTPKKLNTDSNLLIKLDKLDTIPNELTGIYEYEYKHNTDNLKENHYIEIKDTEIVYSGTSDDFDNAREGYYPGFFSKKIKLINITESNIQFKIIVNNNDFYQKPINPTIKYKENSKWTIGISEMERIYTGLISKDKIFINTIGFETRVFIKK